MSPRVIIMLTVLAVVGGASVGGRAGLPEPVRLSGLRLTVVYDNTPGPGGLTADWGFACLVEGAGDPLLFDAGRKPSVLEANMRRMGADPGRVKRVFISHAHGDHYGGLAAVLQASPDATVYVPPSLRSAAQARWPGAAGSFVEIQGPRRLGRHLMSTGPIADTGIAEQALLVLTGRGPIVVTGCAHPGVVTIARKACQLTGQPVQLLLGGFHLLNRSDSEIDQIVLQLEGLGVVRVAPCHCTGGRAQARLAQAFGKDCFACRVGRVITGGALKERTAE